MRRSRGGLGPPGAAAAGGGDRGGGRARHAGGGDRGGGRARHAGGGDRGGGRARRAGGGDRGGGRGWGGGRLGRPGGGARRAGPTGLEVGPSRSDFSTDAVLPAGWHHRFAQNSDWCGKHAVAWRDSRSEGLLGAVANGTRRPRGALEGPIDAVDGRRRPRIEGKPAVTGNPVRLVRNPARRGGENRHSGWATVPVETSGAAEGLGAAARAAHSRVRSSRAASRSGRGRPPS
jgi:hypothetical protein